MSYTRQLASFLQETEYGDIPEACVRKAKNAILDTVGTTLLGAASPSGKIIRRYVRSLGGAPRASVLGGGFRTAAPLAALANGIQAHADDFDDDAWAMMGHPSAPLVSAILAVGEEKETGGKAILCAYILGFEISAKIGKAVNPEHYRLGWHPTSTLGVMGAAAAIAKLLRLPLRQTSMALGIAASAASGLRQNFGTMTKHLHVGNASMEGIMAATLAQRDFTADSEILEAPFGFVRLFTGADECQPGFEGDRIGNPYELIASGLVVKQYPCCAWTHRGIDAMFALVQKHEFNYSEVARIECLMDELASDALIHTRPTTGLEGKFSMEYCLAAAILDRKVGLHQFTDAMVMRPEAQQLVKRVRRRIHPQGKHAAGMKGKALPITVTASLRNGRQYAHRVSIPRGDPENPLSDAELHAKFRECASHALSPRNVEQALDFLAHLEEIETITPMMEILR